VFIGFTQGVDYSGESASDGDSASYVDTIVHSEGDSYSSKGESIYPLHDGMLGGYRDDGLVHDSTSLPLRSAVYMAGAAITTDPAAAAAAAAVGTSNSAPVISPAQALAGLAITLSTLLATPVTPKNQAKRNAEVDKICDQMIQVQADIDAENTRLAARQTDLQVETERLRNEG
jgi:hypothetical protein